MGRHQAAETAYFHMGHSCPNMIFDTRCRTHMVYVFGSQAFVWDEAVPGPRQWQSDASKGRRATHCEKKSKIKISSSTSNLTSDK